MRVPAWRAFDMWTIVDVADTDSTSGRSAGTLAAQLPELDEDAINASLAAPVERTTVWRFFGYICLSLILAAGLITQIGYRNLDRISQHEMIRPWLLTLCEIAGCAIPARQDSRMIVSQQLSIGPHPDFQDISQMLLSFTNTADFSQPLPAIDLVFSDTTGHAVAGRRFYPRHYLGESAASPTVVALSAQQSLTVQLDFATPADEAVNYQVRFVHE